MLRALLLLLLLLLYLRGEPLVLQLDLRYLDAILLHDLIQLLNLALQHLRLQHRRIELQSSSCNSLKVWGQLRQRL